MIQVNIINMVLQTRPDVQLYLQSYGTVSTGQGISAKTQEIAFRTDFYRLSILHVQFATKYKFSQVMMIAAALKYKRFFHPESIGLLAKEMRSSIDTPAFRMMMLSIIRNRHIMQNPTMYGYRYVNTQQCISAQTQSK